MSVAQRLTVARLKRTILANINLALSGMRKPFSTANTPAQFFLLVSAQIRSFFLLSLIFAPLVFYIIFISSRATYPFQTYSLIPSQSRSFSDSVKIVPGYIPCPRHSVQQSSGLLPSTPSQDPAIRVVLACDAHDACCDTTFSPALKAILNQTLVPNHVTILHGCTEEHAHRADPFIISARELMGKSLNASVYDTKAPSPDLVLTPHVCTPFQKKISISQDNESSAHGMELCVLRYLMAPPLESTAAKPNSYVMVLTPSFILEPTALESLWLYLFVHESTPAVKPLSYNATTLHEALVHGDPLRVKHILPNESAHDTTPVKTLPFMMRYGQQPGKEDIDNPLLSATIANVSEDALFNSSNLWLAYSNLFSRSRILRVPLTTHIDPIAHQQSAKLGISSLPPIPPEPMLSLRRTKISTKFMKPYLWSDHAFYKWSAWNDNRDKYAVSLNTEDEKNGFDFWPMPFRKIHGNIADHNSKRVMFLMPWIQMGGSEKCMLDVAERLVQMNWSITFVLTMPFWHEDGLGELSLKNEWLGKALAITSDVFDIVSLSPNHKFSKVLRYIIETRAPDYILTGNARIIYEHLSYIKQVSPKTLVADYNHMVHMDWEVSPGLGGGMPRYGATYTENIDLHLTASDNVTTSMKTWIDEDVLRESPEKVQTCYIGTDPSALHSDQVRPVVRRTMRQKLGLSENHLVILFAGRYVADKGIDVMGEVVRRVSRDQKMSSQLAFVFVGSGEEVGMLKMTQYQVGRKGSNGRGSGLKMILRPPAVGLDELRDYYAMADIFLLPSNNEGIALVLYEAMAAGLLVMGTDVGGQNELIRSDTGVLLPLLNNVAASSSFIVHELQAILKFPSMFADVRERGTELVRARFTTGHFVSCVIDRMAEMKKKLDRQDIPAGPQEEMLNELRPMVADVMRAERVHGLWNQQQTKRDLSGHVTVAVKTYVCDDSIVRQVIGLVRSVRVNYPKVRILLANDGPTRLGEMDGVVDDPYTEEVILAPDSGISIGRNVMVNMTTTEFFVLLDDDHVFDDDTDLAIGISGLQYNDFDIVGIRVRNLPGIDELERIGIFIPRYVAKISNFENKLITLCVWNENNGPGVQSMKVPIRVDVLHNALLARVDSLRKHPWRNILKVNEHMTFFLDQRRAGVKVGYLPSVFVHHRARKYSDCYKQVRFREDKYEMLLEYKDDYLWDVPCGDGFPDAVRKHLDSNNN